MNRLRITLACGDYDRTAALTHGSIGLEGVDLLPLSLPLEEIFFRMLKGREFDCAEMSLSSYVMSLGGEEPPFIAIPVFPSRFFRHSCVFVSGRSDIREPAQLAGKRIGVPEYQMTASVWIRGMLADEYGLPVHSVEYVTGGLEEPGRQEKLALDLPGEIRIRPAGQGKTLARMLADGEIDALYTARTPSSFGTAGVRRLFADPAEVERAYFRKTGIFPIMHTIVIRRELDRAHPWLAQTLYKGFVAAKRLAQQKLDDMAALTTMLPWLGEHARQTRQALGDDWWPYGLHENHAVLDTFLRYHREQGLSKRRWEPAPLFAPQTLAQFRV